MIYQASSFDVIPDFLSDRSIPTFRFMKSNVTCKFFCDFHKPNEYEEVKIEEYENEEEKIQ